MSIVVICQVCRGGDEAARATHNEIRPQRTTAARARCVEGEGGGVCQHQRFQNSIASQPLIIYFNYPISDCSTLLIMQFVIVLH